MIMSPSQTPPTCSVTSVEGAETALGRFTPGFRRIGLTTGQFSLIDMLVAILAQTGPADVVISTWTAGIRDAQAASWLLTTGAIRSFRLLVDRSFPGRQPVYCEQVVERFGPAAIRLTRTHAKFAIVRNDDWAITVRSSMNLNKNTRWEQYDIDDSTEIADFFESVVAELEELTPPGADVRTSTVDAVMSEMQARHRQRADARERAPQSAAAQAAQSRLFG